MSVGVRIRLHAQTGALQADLQRISSLWAEGLQRFGGPWLAGAQFSAVDAFFAPVAMRLQTYGLAVDDAAATAYAQRLLAHPAVQQWQADALLETARDPEHEGEIMASGTLLQDLRAQPAD
jgi:glutathione S-transferase